MPRASSKKAPSNSAPSNNSSAADLFRSATGKAATKELERIDQVFYSYANNSSGMIDPEGIENLCSDLEVDHTDVRILMLAWKMQAERQGYFTLVGRINFLSTTKLRKGPSNFAEFYSFAFEYCLTEEKQKSIDIESICELLDLVLGSQFRAQVDSFVLYLRVSTSFCSSAMQLYFSFDFAYTQIDYKVINMDQWMGFYRFCNEISFPDLKNYDAELAWPLILDNFVDWLGAKRC
ncbi:hypothetical protein RJ639_047182 [Escallonia herrerae]|uniref:Defective in cullin neddylation protein n=1 Tax=Escallonia herrerae TaxID=1293975 RepID=A0AA89B1P2_9ASTE|nr:hypothetical protein RJ639_047182 [Escallonia herrerae]